MRKLHVACGTFLSCTDSKVGRIAQSRTFYLCRDANRLRILLCHSQGRCNLEHVQRHRTVAITTCRRRDAAAATWTGCRLPEDSQVASAFLACPFKPATSPGFGTSLMKLRDDAAAPHLSPCLALRRLVATLTTRDRRKFILLYAACQEADWSRRDTHTVWE